MPIAQISGFLNNKATLMRTISEKLRIVLPRENNCPIEFVRDILSGAKLAIREHETRPIPLPVNEELTVKFCFEHLIKKFPALKDFLPNLYKRPAKEGK